MADERGMEQYVLTAEPERMAETSERSTVKVVWCWWPGAYFRLFDEADTDSEINND